MTLNPEEQVQKKKEKISQARTYKWICEFHSNKTEMAFMNGFYSPTFLNVLYCNYILLQIAYSTLLK